MDKADGANSRARRVMVLLAIAAFASQAMVRAADTLLPQIAADFGTTIGAASIAVTAYALTHGVFLFVAGPIGDRFGKILVVTLACLVSALSVLLCGLAQSLTGLALARFASGVTIAWIVPLGLAFVGDVVAEDRRQEVLARYLTGQILGQLFGQSVSGLLGDFMGWRFVFFMLAALFVLAGAALAFECVRQRRFDPRQQPQPRRGMVSDYGTVLSNPWARIVLIAVFLEGMLSFGIFAYVSSDLHVRCGLSFTAIGAIVALFALGGLATAAAVRVLVKRLGQAGMAVTGGLMMAGAYASLVTECAGLLAPFSVAAIGIGFYMLHNTLLTNATKMCPCCRGAAVSVFGAMLYLGQTVGVTAAAPFVDEFGATPVFLLGAMLMPVVAVWFALQLRLQDAAGGPSDRLADQLPAANPPSS